MRGIHVNNIVFKFKLKWKEEKIQFDAFAEPRHWIFIEFGC